MLTFWPIELPSVSVFRELTDTLVGPGQRLGGRFNLDTLEDVKDYYKNPRADVMGHVPKDCRKVLDVGCASGSFGEALKRDRGVEVWGIEAVEDIARIAQSRLDHVLIGPVESALKQVPDATFDLVTFLDVLEHTVDPGHILRDTRRVLSPNGKVLVSLPNLRYWDVFRRFVWHGEFEYVDSGILDRTHLRFFTQNSMGSLLREADFNVLSMVGINPTPSKTLKFANLLTGGRFVDCQFLQFVIVAEPRSQPL